MSSAPPSLRAILGRAVLGAALLAFLLLSFATKKISRTDPAAERTALHAH